MSTVDKPLPVTAEPAAPAVDATPAVTDATAAPVITDAVPEVPAKTEETKTEEPIAATEATTEAATEEAKPVEPKESGHILYHAPGNFLKEFLPIPPKKVFFWFGEEPVESSQLKAYLAKGKDAASSTAAWASQTGKGLLFFNKHGEDKAAPSGALNLADAEDIKEGSAGEFTFKLHGHKHKFDAQTAAERDSWVAAVKKIAEEAKAKKEEIVSSEGYKEALAKLKPAPVAAVTAPKVSEETPKKSVEETPAAAVEEETTAKKASKSRSRSRGPLGFFKTKKEEAKEKTESEDKKEETAVAEPVVAETAPVVEPTPAVDAPATEVVADESKKEEIAEEAQSEPKKEGRRMSRFETFFKGKSKEAKKEEVAAPTTEEPVAEPVKTEETPAVVEPVAETAPIVAATEEAPKEEVKEEEKKEDTTPVKENRKSSFLTGLKGFTQKVRSPSSEHPPAVAETSKTEEPATETAPTAVTEPATEVPATTEPVTEEPATNGETSKTEKRRSSFFNFGTINKKKGETPATEEPTKTDAVEEPVKPVEATEEAAPEVPKKSIEEKPAEATSPKEHKESPFASIGRRVSKAIRGDKAKKETKPAAAVEETKEESKTEEPTTEALTLPDPIKQEETSAAKPAVIGDVVPEAVTVGTPAHQSTPTVSATA